MTKGYKSVYHEAGLPFYRKKNTTCGIALRLIVFFGKMALRFDVQIKQLLWAFSNLIIKAYD